MNKNKRPNLHLHATLIILENNWAISEYFLKEKSVGIFWCNYCDNFENIFTRLNLNLSQLLDVEVSEKIYFLINIEVGLIKKLFFREPTY